jgi:DNA-binding transcriptional MocR family regulator
MASTISFARGAPSLDIIDVDGLRAAADQAFTADPGGMTAYGTAIGYVPLREWIAERHQVAPEQVLVTNGSMQADAFLFDALVAPDDTVIVERPTYDRTLLSLRNRGADVRMVELEHDGIDTAALERVLAAGARPKLAHIIPNFQNPAGYTLSAGKRQRLLELARAHEFTIFEDDPYVSLRFEGESLPTMLSMGEDVVVYASSFSKTVCPGIRVGYLVGPADLIARIVKIATSTSHRAWCRRRSSTSSAARGRSTAPSRPFAPHCGSGPRPCATRCPSTCRTPRSSRPRADISSGSTCPTAPTSPRCSMRRPPAVCSSSRAPTSCWKVASRRCAWRTPA